MSGFITFLSCIFAVTGCIASMTGGYGIRDTRGREGVKRMVAGCFAAIGGILMVIACVMAFFAGRASL